MLNEIDFRLPGHSAEETADVLDNIQLMEEYMMEMASKLDELENDEAADENIFYVDFAIKKEFQELIKSKEKVRIIDITKKYLNWVERTYDIFESNAGKINQSAFLRKMFDEQISICKTFKLILENKHLTED